MSTNAIQTSWRCWLGVLAAVLALPVATKGSPIELDLATYSPYVLQPNTTGQTISIFVYASGGSPALQVVSGVNLEVETVPVEATTGIGAYPNSPSLGGPISPTAPKISNVNLLASNALFASNNTGQTGGALQQGGSYISSPTAAQESQFWSAQTTTVGSLDDAMITGTPVLLATVTFDTTGVANGTYSLVLDDPNTQQTSFPGTGGLIFPVVVDGFLTVPEPASIGLLAVFLAGMLLRRRRLAVTPATSSDRS